MFYKTWLSIILKSFIIFLYLVGSLANADVVVPNQELLMNSGGLNMSAIQQLGTRPGEYWGSGRVLSSTGTATRGTSACSEYRPDLGRYITYKCFVLSNTTDRPAALVAWGGTLIDDGQSGCRLIVDLNVGSPNIAGVRPIYPVGKSSDGVDTEPDGNCSVSVIIPAKGRIYLYSWWRKADGTIINGKMRYVMYTIF